MSSSYLARAASLLSSMEFSGRQLHPQQAAEIVHVLADNHFIPLLPEPDGIGNGGLTHEWRTPFNGSVWTTPGSGIIHVGQELDGQSPEEARKHAYALLAAVDISENPNYS